MTFIEILDKYVEYAVENECTTIQAYNTFVKTLSLEDLDKIKGKSLIMIRVAEIQKNI